MKYALLDDNNVVVQVQPYTQDGFIEVEDNIISGMIKNGTSFVLPEKTAEQTKAEKQAQFDLAWESLKIGYTPTTQNAFRIKYGSELGEAYTATALYNLDTLEVVSQTDHLYKMNRENVNILNAKKNSEFLDSTSTAVWYGSLGNYQLNNIEVGIILLKANQLVQQLADETLGA